MILYCEISVGWPLHALYEQTLVNGQSPVVVTGMLLFFAGCAGTGI